MTKKTFDDDHLGFEALGETFTKLVQSMEGPKVISIEAGFGRGKTFFRKRWAGQLREAGEVVVEIDARQSDHSGDPVVTFIGALVGALGEPDGARAKKFWDETKKWGGVAARSVGGMVMGKAVDGVIEAADGILTDDDTPDLLDDLVEGAGEGLSKAAKKMIGAQLAAEKARQELPAQLKGLLEALTEGKPNKRVVILIDELDRCHPDYAIQLLESMKLVFDEKGYVFVLMVNAEHLERIAAHRFVGWHDEKDDAAREPYLDKFVDMRLTLPAPEEKIAEAARAFAMELPKPDVPFGEGPEFTIERAAQVAADLAPLSGLSMRQIKGVLLRVELAVRAYQGLPVDVPLLVWLGFVNAVDGPRFAANEALLRARIHPDIGEEIERNVRQAAVGEDWENDVEKHIRPAMEHFVARHCMELSELSEQRYRLPAQLRLGDLLNTTAIVFSLAPWYIPRHQSMLDHVHSLVAG
ncbi:KAP family NTPase [Rhodobacteraceae bacterium N5(2021)]|uniref:KAP family NTPase n=1 Tax=Gymnodinialimonas phycosphaerae TaxID=2841589 RepID=A0A975TU69_9RHOB|nr:KAP family NTPase [Gymnodinialimonas phycosphaerae]MBY4894788.1 KAP family NTPase [Gymnodinialimonas phycosphaerae]